MIGNWEVPVQIPFEIVFAIQIQKNIPRIGSKRMLISLSFMRDCDKGW